MTEEKRQGFTQINNDILEFIANCRLNGSQFSILMIIWRYTFGFQRVDHDFSVGYLQKATGLSDRTVKKELGFLIESNILNVTQYETRTTPRRIKFNSNCSTWKVKHNIDLVNNTSLHENNGGEQSFTTVVNNTSLLNENEWVTIVHPNKESNINLNKSIKENIYSSFDEFYNCYPRKKAKEQARKAWDKLSKEKSFNAEYIIQNTLNYAATCKEINQDIKYIPFPATYLNQKRYEDYDVINPEGIRPNNSNSSSSKLSSKNQQLMDEIRGDLFSDSNGSQETILDYKQLLSEF